MSKEFDYTKVQHVTSVDQSDREVPYNLRQSGPTKVELLISTRVRKSPYWHLSMQAGCWRATVYNRIYHPRGYVKPEDGGAMVEYDAIVNHVTMWNVALLDTQKIEQKGSFWKAVMLSGPLLLGVLLGWIIQVLRSKHFSN